MKNLKSRLAAIAVAGLAIAGVAVPASAGSDQYIPVDTGGIKANGNYVTYASTPKVDLKFIAYCASGTAHVAVYATKAGHTNRPVDIELTASHAGFKTQVDTDVIAKPIGSEGVVRLDSGKTVRPLGTATVELSLEQNGEVIDLGTVVFQRPHVNCASIGGATLKGLEED